MAGEFAAPSAPATSTAWRRIATGWNASDGASRIIALSPGCIASSLPKPRERPRDRSAWRYEFLWRLMKRARGFWAKTLHFLRDSDC
jgi:hypothetical protein